MKKFTKVMTGAAAAALVTLTAAAPASAQYYGRYNHYDDDDIDLGDVAAGVAIVGGIAVAIDALTRDNDYGRYDRYGRNGYGSGYGYGSEQASVNACARAAQRYGGRVQITDIDRRGYDSYRVRGRAYVRDYDDGRWGRGYDYDRESFTCYAQNGRVYDFRI